MIRRCGQGVRLSAEVLVRGKYRGIVVGHGQYEHEWLVRIYNGVVEPIHIEDLEALG